MPGEKPYECDGCKKRFSQLSALGSHKNTHTRDKPYKCDICNKRFSESHKLTQHKISAHKKNESFECDNCKKTFRKGQSLKHHWRSHLRDGLLFCRIAVVSPTSRFANCQFAHVDSPTFVHVLMSVRKCYIYMRHAWIYKSINVCRK